jgi:pimeloyl-ACP methyl ester carboxylesterase
VRLCTLFAPQASTQDWSPAGLERRAVDRLGRLRYTEFDRGGHFAYTTDPDLVVGDVREFFASLT